MKEIFMLSLSTRTLTVHFQSMCPRAGNTLVIMLFTALSLMSTVTQGADSIADRILPLRDRAALQDDIIADRLDTLIPILMRREGIGAWVLIAREYNEDPIVKTMLPATWLNARRRTILLFYRDKKNNTIEKLAVARYNVGKQIISAWDKEKTPDQWEKLITLIKERNPKKIGLNFSKDHNIADGLDKTDYDEFMAYLPKNMHAKVVSAEQLA